MTRVLFALAFLFFCSNTFAGLVLPPLPQPPQTFIAFGGDIPDNIEIAKHHLQTIIF